jgi:hypothetical protein
MIVVDDLKNKNIYENVTLGAGCLVHREAVVPAIEIEQLR